MKKYNKLFALLVIPSLLSAAQLGSTYTGAIANWDKDPVLMFSGVSLNEVKSVSAMFTKDQMDTEANTPTYTSEYIPLKSDEDVVTNLVVRFQSYLGEYTKCVELELSQNGADIYGRVINRYYSAQYAYRVGESVSGWTANKNQTYQVCNVALFDTTDDNLSTTLYWNGGGYGTHLPGTGWTNPARKPPGFRARGPALPTMQRRRSPSPRAA